MPYYAIIHYIINICRCLCIPAFQAAFRASAGPRASAGAGGSLRGRGGSVEPSTGGGSLGELRSLGGGLPTPPRVERIWEVSFHFVWSSSCCVSSAEVEEFTGPKSVNRRLGFIRMRKRLAYVLVSGFIAFEQTRHFFKKSRCQISESVKAKVRTIWATTLHVLCNQLRWIQPIYAYLATVSTSTTFSMNIQQTSTEVQTLLEPEYNEGVKTLIQTDFAQFDTGGIRETEFPRGTRNVYYRGVQPWEQIAAFNVMLFPYLRFLGRK